MTVDVRLHDPDISASEFHPFQVKATPYDTPPEGETLAPSIFELPSLGVASLGLPGGRWVLEAQVEGYWSSKAPVVVAPGVQPVTIDLWPAGVVKGRLQFPKNDDLPARIPVIVRPAPEGALDGRLKPASVVCPLDRKGRWECEVPAGDLDLRIQVQDYVPRFAWSVDILRDKTRDLGSIQMIRGSAVQGWLTTEDGSELQGGTVHLRPRHAEIPNAGERSRVQSQAFDSPVNDRGFFQLIGVPPGDYVLEADMVGFANATTTVRVASDRVTEVTPALVLGPPLELEVYVTPPLDPWGRPWVTDLQMRTEPGARVFQSVAKDAVPDNGALSITKLSPGSYNLKLATEDGDIFWQEIFDLTGDHGPLAVDLPYVEVEGEVTLGDEALVSTVYFGGRFGAVRIELLTDEEGKFQGFLPHPGDWKVTVLAEEPTVVRDLDAVTVEPKSSGRLAEVSIHLANTRLAGTVVDTDGVPQANALVNARTMRGVLQTYTDDGGAFEFNGLEEATAYEVVAKVTPGLISDTVMVRITEGMENPELELIVEPMVVLQGLLATAVGPVSGASIHVVVIDPADIGFGKATVSGSGGQWDMKLPRRSKAVSLAIAAPGFAFRLLAVPVTERRVDVALDTAGGTLVFELSEPILGSADTAQSMLMVFHGDARLVVTPLLHWAKRNGGEASDPLHRTRYVIPMMAPGEYGLCAVRPGEAGSLATMWRAAPQCATGYLSPGGELRLAMP